MDDIPVPLPAKPERFMDRLRAFMRARHLAYRTEKTYCTWILDFIRFHNKQHPELLDTTHIDQWLSHLANNRHVTINTQKRRLMRLCFFIKNSCRSMLGIFNLPKRIKGVACPRCLLTMKPPKFWLK